MTTGQKVGQWSPSYYPQSPGVSTTTSPVLATPSINHFSGYNLTETNIGYWPYENKPTLEGTSLLKLTNYHLTLVNMKIFQVTRAQSIYQQEEVDQVMEVGNQLDINQTLKIDNLEESSFILIPVIHINKMEFIIIPTIHINKMELTLIPIIHINKMEVQLLVMAEIPMAILKTVTHTTIIHNQEFLKLIQEILVLTQEI